MKDYFKILGVSPDASEDTIKHAYRKLALLHHPDKNRNNSDEKFKEINEAYVNLRDETDRELYRKEYLKSFTFIKVDHKLDVCLKQDLPIYKNFFLSLENIYMGCTKRFKITRKVSQLKEQVKIVSIIIPAGSKDGTMFKFSRLGNKFPKRIPADVIFVLNIREHPLFQRVENDLVCNVFISNEQSRATFELTVTTICGNLLKLEVTPDTVYGGIIIDKYGLRTLENVNIRGHLRIHFTIVENPNKKTEMKKDKPIRVNVEVTLEEIFSGCIKHILITRNVAEASGAAVKKDEFFTLNIPAGCENDSEFTYFRCGNQRFNTTAGDVIFTIKQLIHPLFERQGTDIIFRAIISHKEAESLSTVIIPSLCKGTISVQLTKEILEKGALFPEYGLPSMESNGIGSLLVYFNVL